MNIKTITASSVLALTLSMGAAQAVPLIGGETIKIKYSNWEQLMGILIDPDTGRYAPPKDGTGYADGEQDLRGIVQLTTIFQPAAGTTPTWQDGDNGEHLWGVFYGFDVNTVSAGGTMLDYNGGSLDIYILDDNIDPYAWGIAGWTGDNTYEPINDLNGDGIADADPWLSVVFEPTSSVVDPTSTLNALTNVATRPFTGNGSGYMSVGTTTNGTGTANDAFDTNSMVDTAGNIHDFYMQNDFRTAEDKNGDGLDDLLLVKCYAGGTGEDCVRFEGGWDLVSEDPVLGRVPEPGILALLGAGLFGLLGLRRKNA